MRNLHNSYRLRLSSAEIIGKREDGAGPGSVGSLRARACLDYQTESGNVLIDALSPTRLYMVTPEYGSSATPS